ncbi:MAG: 30S ribosome-binding factor RbfA [Chloroflexi bacterium]|nr:30S ribosome-binding factor RbfA [Chloroflexota bacterium]
MTRRIERVNNLIRDEISEMLQRQVKDPRLGNFISITEVSTSTDLKYAKIFVSSIRTDEEKDKVLSALTTASGFFRSELAKRLRMRRIPELSFHWDDSIEHGAHILEIMDKLHSEQKP